MDDESKKAEAARLEAEAKNNEAKEKQKAETLESVLDTQPPAPDTRKYSDADAEAIASKLATEKRMRKEAETRNRELQARVEEYERSKSGNNYEMNLNDEISKIASDYDTDPKFVASVVAAAEKRAKAAAKAELEAEFNPKIEQITRDKAQEHRNSVFEGLFSKTLDEMPDYKDVVSKDAIKALAFNPANAKKTLPQIIEETYGNAISGKRTLEDATHGREPEKPDLLKPGIEGYKKINADPALKKEHEQRTLDALKNIL